MPLFSATLTIATHFMLASYRHDFPLSSQSWTLQLHSFPISIATLVHPPWWLMFCIGFWLLIRFSIQTSSWFLVPNKVKPKNNIVGLMWQPFSVLSSSPIWYSDRVDLLVPQTVGLRQASELNFWSNLHRRQTQWETHLCSQWSRKCSKWPY